MSEQGTGEMGRWGDSELQEMELRLETKLREIVGSGVQWLVRAAAGRGHDGHQEGDAGDEG